MVEVSEEDPDSSLSEALAHQRTSHGTSDVPSAMTHIIEVTRDGA